jgi:hypothetical protein
LLQKCLTLALLLLGAESSFADVEEDRIEAAVSRLGEVATRYQYVVDDAAAANDDASLTALGEKLWRTAVEDVGVGNPDDRSLYWARLAIRREVRKLRPTQALGEFERASRGMTETRFGDGNELRLLVSGFDPFLLDEDIAQSNPYALRTSTKASWKPFLRRYWRTEICTWR